MSKWAVGDLVVTPDGQRAIVIIVYDSPFCVVETNSGARFTVKDKELALRT